MASFNFSGDIDGISDRQLEFINNIILERGFENSKVTFAPVGKAGDNYAATVKRITIEGENGNLTMIAKLAPTNEIIRQTISSAIIFNNEHKMYVEILPKLVQFQKDAGIPEEDQLRYAKCYGSLSEQPYEVILLEDLKPLGFIMLDRFVPLTDDCIRSMMKNFAIIHSLSYVLKEKEPETYEKYKADLTDLWVTQARNDDMKMYLQNLENDTLIIVDDPDYNNLLKNKVSGFYDMAVKLSKVDYENKYAVILQGDSWTNNIMFKFEMDTPVQSIMIDYQLSRNASPVTDIMYMIFNCTDHKTRKEHFYNWINYYHSELDKSLSKFNLKVNYVYPRTELDADLKRYGSYLLGLSVCLASMLLRKTEDAAKILDAIKSDNIMDQMLELGISQLDEESRYLFRERVIGLIDSFTKFELL